MRPSNLSGLTKHKWKHHLQKAKAKMYICCFIKSWNHSSIFCPQPRWFPLQNMEYLKSMWKLNFLSSKIGSDLQNKSKSYKHRGLRATQDKTKSSKFVRIFSYLQNYQKEDSRSTKSIMLHPTKSSSYTSHPEIKMKWVSQIFY